MCSEVSSVKSLTVDFRLSGRSIMYIRKSNGLKIELCETPASTDDQFEHWPLSTTSWNLLFKKLVRGLRRFSDIPICSIFNSNPSGHTLSNALIMSKKFAFTWRVELSSKLDAMNNG